MSKKHLYKIMAFMMAICAIFALLPASYPANAATETRTLYYNPGDSKLYSDFDLTVQVTDLTGWHGNGDTLTLTNFNYSTAADGALWLRGNVVLVLEGNNTIECTAANGSGGYYPVIRSLGGLTITGDGSLYIKNNDFSTNSVFETGILVQDNLVLRGNVDVTLYADANSYVMGVKTGNSLNMYDNAVLRIDHKTPFGNYGIDTKNLIMYGGKIYISSETKGTAVGLEVDENFQVMYGEIYSKCLSETHMNSVRFFGEIPSNLSVSGSSGFSFDEPYTIKGTLTNLLPSVIISSFLSPVSVSEDGVPVRGAYLNNVKITGGANSVLYTLVVNYHDEGGSFITAESISGLTGGSVITGNDLRAVPKDYSLKEPLSVTVNTHIGVNVVVVKDVYYTLTAEFIDGDGKQISTQKITGMKDATVTDADLSIPAGYELKDSFSHKLTKDETVKVNVQKTDFVLNVEYIDEGGKQVGTQTIPAARDATVTAANLSIPAGYELKGGFSHKVTKDETVKVNVQKTSFALNIEYIDEDGKQVGTQKITGKRDVTVTAADLSIPAGYELKGGFSHKVTKDETVSVNVQKTNFVLYVEYIDEDGKQVGTQTIPAAKDATVTDANLKVPAGYELKDSFSHKVTKDETVSVTVVGIAGAITQIIHYRDESGKLIDAKELIVKKDDIITNSDLRSPTGYKIRDTVSEQVTDGKTPIDVIVIPFADEDQYKNTSYIDGYPDGLFKPNDPIKRSETASIFYKLFAAADYTPKHSVLTRFTDLKSDHWAYDRIAFAVDWGIMQGYPGDTFQPDDNITRAELVTVLYNLNLTPLIDTLPPILFNDISNHWAVDIINLMSANGMLDIYSGNKFDPDKKITRAEVVSLIHYYLQRSDTWEGDKSFADVQPDHWSYEEIMNAANGT